MLYATITIDLPSEAVLRERTVLDWIAGLIGREPKLDTGREVTTIDGLSVFKRIVEVLEDVDIDDILSMTIDRKAAYVDLVEDSGDLATAVAELEAKRALERTIQSMSLTLSERMPNSHVLVELELQREVETGKPELHVEIAARLKAMQVQKGDSAGEFAERLRSFAQDPERLAAACEDFAAIVDKLRAALAERFADIAESVVASPARLRLIRPGPKQLDHMRRLTWGPAVRTPKYRAVPITNRRGAYDEPFYHHYFDPYFDFVAWVTLEEIVTGRGWRGLDFEVVDASGEHLFGAEDSEGQRAWAGDYEGLGADEAPVSIVDGELVIHPAVPAIGRPDPGEVDDPRLVLGYGGDGQIDEGAVGANWDAGPIGVEGGDMGGSCGASCGGCGGGEG